jgi:hypothetical protein
MPIGGLPQRFTAPCGRNPVPVVTGDEVTFANAKDRRQDLPERRLPASLLVHAANAFVQG